MSKRKRHGYEECLKYMHLIKEGRSIHSIHVEYGINGERLHVLWNQYQLQGKAGLLKKKNIKADYTLKKEIVLDIEENRLTLHAASLKYGASPPTNISMVTAIQNGRLGSFEQC
ncbi:MAG: hypothetical protein IKD25_03625 [Bacteroidaceae bacterium]|nr:hypothetical protein [Bacteroidaceae bacterium]